MKKFMFLSLLCGLWMGIAVHELSAQDQTHETATAGKTEKNPWRAGLLGIAAAIAVGLSALGSGMAQARIGAAAAGALAEKPELLGSMIVLEAIPETMIILGFVVSVLIIFVL